MGEGIVRGLVEYHGICENIPKDLRSFKTLALDSIIDIKEGSSDIDDILKVRVKGEIDNSRIVRTASGVSIDGQELTGWKLVMYGRLKIQVDYSSLSKGPAVYVANYFLNFSSFITLSKKTSITSRVYPNVYVEDIHVKNLGKKKLFTTATIIITADVD